MIRIPVEASELLNKLFRPVTMLHLHLGAQLIRPRGTQNVYAMERKVQWRFCKSATLFFFLFDPLKISNFGEGESIVLHTFQLRKNRTANFQETPLVECAGLF